MDKVEKGQWSYSHIFVTLISQKPQNKNVYHHNLPGLKCKRWKYKRNKTEEKRKYHIIAKELLCILETIVQPDKKGKPSDLGKKLVQVLGSDPRSWSTDSLFEKRNKNKHRPTKREK